MRVAVVTETFVPSVDGVVTRLTHALDWLAAQGHELLVVAPDLGQGDAWHGVPVVGVPAVRLPAYRSRAWGTPSPRVARALDAFGPQVVHAWQPDLVGAPAVAWCARRGVPLVTSYHTDVPGYLGRYYGALRLFRRPVTAWERSLARGAELTLVTSRAMRGVLEGRGYRRVCVLPRGVDLAARDPRFANRDMRTMLTRGAPDAPLLLFVGRVAAEKNLASLAPLMRAHPEWRLAVVGDGPERAALERLFPAENTRFTGFLGGGDLSAAFASADAFVFPSTSETLGLVILEAQASGLPVVAAASPATCEQLRSGVDGLVYDAGDPVALEGAVAAVLGDTALRERLAAAGLVEARENGWDGASRAVEAALELAVRLQEGRTCR